MLSTALLSCSPNFPRASITRYTHAKHEPILNYITRVNFGVRVRIRVSIKNPQGVKDVKNYFLTFRYYKTDTDVKDDVELQAYLNEVSLNGAGPNGGIGRVRNTAIALL